MSLTNDLTKKAGEAFLRSTATDQDFTLHPIAPRSLCDLRYFIQIHYNSK